MSLHSPDTLEAIRREHGGSASRMAATLVLAGVPLAEVETLKRGPWAGMAGQIAAVREDLGVAPRQPMARYFLLCGKLTSAHTPTEMRRLLLLGLEAGSPDDARGSHGEEELS